MTDATGTSLLLTNVSNLTLVVQPYANTTLQETPGNDPTDAPDQLALATMRTAVSTKPPPYVHTGDAFVPPHYSICGTTGLLSQYAGVYVRGDAVLSVTWRVTDYVEQQVVREFEPKGFQTAQAVLNCANSAIAIAQMKASETPDQLYHDALTGAQCYQTYESFFTDDEHLTVDVATAATSHDLDSIATTLTDLDKLGNEFDFVDELARLVH